MLNVLAKCNDLLQKKNASALDVATLAVTLLENDSLFNAGHGAVFTQSGTHELEASVMVSTGYRKQGVGVAKVSHVRHPIMLAKEMLIRGEEADGHGGGAEGHVFLEGDTVERSGSEWGVQMCKPSHHWTKKRWDQHRKGLGLSTDWETYCRAKKDIDRQRECDDHASDEDDAVSTTYNIQEDKGEDPSWDGTEYIPQGTVGAVVLDSKGVLCVATSTGGVTNKLPGRLGDTPTIGAGFYAEQWRSENPFDRPNGLAYQQQTHRYSAISASRPPVTQFLTSNLSNMIADCLPNLSAYLPLLQNEKDNDSHSFPIHTSSRPHAVALSGTGNGDSFLKLSGARMAAAMTRFSFPPLSLQWSVTRMAGPDGMLQQSADNRWGKTGEGEGGIIGIEYALGGGKVVADFNCGGMFRAWIDGEGKARMMVFREEY